uniref:Uncharacterized protein n=1 Tax=Romanomermis culicivorax TaxID=13658 RepID=A0A915JW52_ROMCU
MTERKKFLKKVRAERIFDPLKFWKCWDLNLKILGLPSPQLVGPLTVSSTKKMATPIIHIIG